MKNDKEYYVYMIRCKDNSLYTGMTTDLDRRMKEHLERGKKGAKYTSSHYAIKMEIAWRANDKIKASKLEYYIKTLTKAQKEELIVDPRKLQDFLSEKIEYKDYINAGVEDKNY